MPFPLPPQIGWSPGLLLQLSRADRAIGRLAGEGSDLPNPHILLRPFIRREAVLSSKIEGTQATLGELLAVEAGAHVDRSPEDLHEVANYVVALEHGIRLLKKLPLSLRLVRGVHAKLMHGVRGDSATPGEFRRSQNWIGTSRSTPATAKYVPPPADALADTLGAWEKFLHDRSLPPLVQAALLHSQFEAIHPFLDGNGRVGRLLITLFLIERDVLPSPLLYLSAYFEATRQTYYDRLLGVTEAGEWEAWIEYFLAGVEKQSDDALRRTAEINDVLRGWRRQVVRVGSTVAPQAIDLLAENPFWTARGIAKRLGVAFTTAQRVLERLESLGIVDETTSAKRDRVYCARRILRILEAPVRPGSRKAP
ncbi:MAG TPA: Fic family protein [Planctomycetota bacterium]|nr:Fic family protein [Planctomycetota bacterium]